MSGRRFHEILNKVGRYYSDKVVAHGDTPSGVDWNSPESQGLRFEQLLKVCDTREPFSLTDYGCGYGALVDYMKDRGLVFTYRGYDISDVMLARARELHRDLDSCEFLGDETRLTPTDYTVASGVFNVKMDTSDEEWLKYVLATLGRFDSISEKGFAFNILTKYSDKEYMRDDLYYADPCFLFDYCKTKFSKEVSLLHDYGLYEFTIILRK
ncbi:MAG: class I SAM-dependent methyltransferase [Thermodesulfobacteriota bacterium]